MPKYIYFIISLFFKVTRDMVILLFTENETQRLGWSVVSRLFGVLLI